jgi:hypothetical protein
MVGGPFKPDFGLSGQSASKRTKALSRATRPAQATSSNPPCKAPFAVGLWVISSGKWGGVMRIDECDLEGIDFISAAPFQRAVPEDEWLNAAMNRKIPTELFDLYRSANFLSFGSAPKFLSDPENLLFSYFSLIVRSVQESLVDAHEQVALFTAAHKLVYDPMKKIRGEPWDPGAAKREIRHFRDLLIALHTAFDALADLIAIFFPGAINRLEVGRAQFSRVEAWVEKPLPASGIIVTPSEFHLRKVYDALVPLVRVPPPEKDWLPLMRMLRNKAAHLGSPLFRQVGLPRAGDGTLFAFIPREWPYLWEKKIKRQGEQQEPRSLFPKELRTSLIHEDIDSYAAGLLAKVQRVIAAVTGVLHGAYEQFKDLPENHAALMQLKSNFERYEFEHFA